MSVTEDRLASSKLLTRQRKWQLRFPEKRRAHEAVRQALLKGLLVKEPCVECGTTDHVDAHHERYDAPLDVTWLCRRHHARRHARKILKGGKSENAFSPERSSGGELTNHKRHEKRFLR